MIDINQLIDQQELDEERDHRIYGNNEFDYIGRGTPSAVEEEGE